MWRQIERGARLLTFTSHGLRRKSHSLLFRLLCVVTKHRDWRGSSGLISLALKGWSSKQSLVFGVAFKLVKPKASKGPLLLLHTSPPFMQFHIDYYRSGGCENKTRAKGHQVKCARNEFVPSGLSHGFLLGVEGLQCEDSHNVSFTAGRPSLFVCVCVCGAGYTLHILVMLLELSQIIHYPKQYPRQYPKSVPMSCYLPCHTC